MEHVCDVEGVCVCVCTSLLHDVVCTRLKFIEAVLLIFACHTAKPKKKSRKKLLPREPDHTYLTCGHHQAIVASLSLFPLVRVEGRVTVLVVGLGGGALPMYIRKHVAMVSGHYVQVIKNI